MAAKLRRHVSRLEVGGFAADFERGVQARFASSALPPRATDAARRSLARAIAQSRGCVFGVAGEMVARARVSGGRLLPLRHLCPPGQRFAVIAVYDREVTLETCVVGKAVSEVFADPDGLVEVRFRCGAVVQVAPRDRQPELGLRNVAPGGHVLRLGLGPILAVLERGPTGRARWPDGRDSVRRYLA